MVVTNEHNLYTCCGFVLIKTDNFNITMVIYADDFVFISICSWNLRELGIQFIYFDILLLCEDKFLNSLNRTFP